MKILLPVFFLLLTACSNVPVAIKNAPEPDWQLSQLQGKADSHRGDAVRWGGQIVKVENAAEGSTLNIVQFPLNSFGKPVNSRDSQGRFLATTTDFIDPYIFKSGTLVTVAGQVSSEQSITIDQKTIRVPVVTINAVYRWSKQSYQRDPYWYGYPYYYDRFGYGVSYPHWRSYWYYRQGYYW